MTPDKIILLTKRYEERLSGLHIPRVRMDVRRTFGFLNEEEILAHAHYLCGGIPEFAYDPGKWGKTNRHYTAVQMCLSYADWYTLEDLMNHNHP